MLKTPGSLENPERWAHFCKKQIGLVGDTGHFLQMLLLLLLTKSGTIQWLA